MFDLDEPFWISTAGGDVLVKEYGSVKFEVDNGETIILTKCLYWENAPKLMSVIVMQKLKCKIEFGDRTTIFLPSGDVLYSWDDIEETPILRFTEEFMPEIAKINNETALIAQPSPRKVSAKIWHQRLNHIPMKRLKE